MSHVLAMTHFLILTRLIDRPSLFFFFFNDTATTEIYTLSLHDALPISRELTGAGVVGQVGHLGAEQRRAHGQGHVGADGAGEDRKSTRLNSSHTVISYAVFCLKKKKNKQQALQQYDAYVADTLLDMAEA